MVMRDWQQGLADARAWRTSCLRGRWSADKGLGVEPGLLRLEVVVGVQRLHHTRARFHSLDSSGSRF
eukprot:3936896-Rhodomonas_salina.2